MKIQVKNRQLCKVSAKIFKKTSSSVRFHQPAARYCLPLDAKSATIADNIWYNQKTGTGFLILPSCRHLEDYKKNLLDNNEDLIIRSSLNYEKMKSFLKMKICFSFNGRDKSSRNSSVGQT